VKIESVERKKLRFGLGGSTPLLLSPKGGGRPPAPHSGKRNHECPQRGVDEHQDEVAQRQYLLRKIFLTVPKPGSFYFAFAIEGARAGRWLGKRKGSSTGTSTKRLKKREVGKDGGKDTVFNHDLRVKHLSKPLNRLKGVQSGLTSNRGGRPRLVTPPGEERSVGKKSLLWVRKKQGQEGYQY